MRLAVLTDVHGNLPALQVALAAIQRAGCDAIFHTGDAIGIGPCPAECLDLLLNTPRVRPVMGNHDAWFSFGLPEPQPSWMSDGELKHQRWVHSCLDPALRTVVGGWPYLIQEVCEGVRISFVHYGLRESQRGFVPVIKNPDSADLDGIFSSLKSDIVFYGHEHSASDLAGRARYVNPGSLGCHTEPIARFAMLTCRKNRYKLKMCRIPYDDRALFEQFERRAVPERDFIYRAFFGGKGSGFMSHSG